jgi:RNA polymerase sigma factor (sigma-70 family)
MSPGENFDDEEIRILLVGSEVEIGSGLIFLNRHLRDGMCGYLRQHFPGIPPQDLPDIWGETLVSVLAAARARRFDGDQPLLPWLCQIARARAIDHLRARTRYERVLDAVAAALEGTHTGQVWGGLTPVERNEVLGLIRDAVASLPARQRLVMQVYVDQYPDSASMERLQEEVSRVTRRPETLAAVKRALQEARSKVREFLQRRGYDLGRRGGP